MATGLSGASHAAAPGRGVARGDTLTAFEDGRSGAGRAADIATLHRLQRVHGNRAVQRLVHRASPVPPRDAPARSASDVVSSDGAAAAATPPVAVALPSPVVSRPSAVQRDAKDDAPWWKVVDFGESVAWRLMGQFAPQLVPIVRKGPEGIVDSMKSIAAGAADGVFGGLMGPVRTIAGAGNALSAQFSPLVASLQDAATNVAANDCSPIGHAAEAIERTAGKIVTPIVATIQPVIAKIEGFLGAAWDRVGAPIWGWIKDYAGKQWDQIKQVAGWIWDFYEPMRSLGGKAWAWLKNMLGIGDGPEGENGILQWLQAKVEAVWVSIKATLAPFAKQIAIVRSAAADVVRTLTGPIVRAGEIAVQIGSGLGWLATHIARGNAIVEARSYVEKSLIPPLRTGLRQMGGAITGVASSIGHALGSLAGGLEAAHGAVADSVLQFAGSAIQWIAGEIMALANWANDKLVTVATSLQSATGQLERFIDTLAGFLQKVEGAVANVWSLPLLMAGKVWNAIPACIRDPVVDYLVPLILRQVELFEELGRDPAAWQKTKAQVMTVVRKVFVDHDLAGAVKAAFFIVLRAFNLPPEMLGKVADKAMVAWDVVVKKPIDFIKNTVRSLGHGFKLLWANIATHLGHGVEGWLFGELADQGVQPPASWTSPKALFGFVTDVLGLSAAHVAELAKQKLDKGVVDGVVRWVGRFQRAWDWVTDAIDTSKSAQENAQGLVAKAGDFGKTVLSGAAEWVAGKVATELAVLAAGAAASGGLSEVVDVARRIYKAMVTAKRYGGRVLQMASDTLDLAIDIAGGNIEKVGGEFEKLMDRGMPVVIGFLADQVGLGGVGAAIRNIVEKLRARVDDAILWLIDKVKGGVAAVAGGLKAGVAAVTDWLGFSRSFTAGAAKHRVFLAGSATSAELMVASEERPMAQLLREGGELERSVTAAREPRRTAALGNARTAYAEFLSAKGVLQTGGANKVAIDRARDAFSNALAKLTNALAVTGVDLLDMPRPTELGDLQPEVEYFFPGASSSMKVGTFVAVSLRGDEWWLEYEPSDQRVRKSSPGRIMTPAFLPGTRQRAYQRVIDGDIETRLSSGTGADGRASWVHAQPLAPTAKYTAPGRVAPHGWSRLGPKADWVRLHLINGTMGGPATTWNLVPGPSAVNAEMYVGHERSIREQLTQKRYFFYGADVEYWSDSDAGHIRKASDFAKAITVSYAETVPDPITKTFHDSPGSMTTKRYAIRLPTVDEVV